MSHRPYWTLLGALVLLSCTDTLAPSPQGDRLRPDDLAPSLGIMLGADAQFVFPGSCVSATTQARADGMAIDEAGRMAFNVFDSGTGKFTPCVSEGANSRRLPVPTGGQGQIHDMNDHLWLGGWVGTQFGGIHATLWRPDGTMIDVSAHLGNSLQSRVTAINNAGDATGYTMDLQGTRHAFIMKVNIESGDVIESPTLLTEFEVFGTTYVEPTAINMSRQIVGIYVDPVSGRGFPFLWDNGALYDLKQSLPVSDPIMAIAWDINDHGHIAGSYDRPSANGSFVRRGVVWFGPFEVTELPLVLPSDGRDLTEAHAINNAGVVLGESGFSVAAWHDGDASRLGLNGSPWAINESNQAAGRTDVNGQTVAVRWNRIEFNLPPTVVVKTVPELPLEGSVVTFDASESRDPNNHGIKSYRWNFGDGSPEVTTTQPTVTHTYVDNFQPMSVPKDPTQGTPYKLSVWATDVFGEESNGQGFPVDVKNAPPAPYAGGDRTVFVGETFPLQIDARDPGVKDMPWEFSISFDGKPGASIKSNEPKVTVSHAYTATGTFPVKISVRDRDGGVGTTTVTITVVERNRPPVANAGVSYGGDEGSTIEFTGAASDPDGDALTYAWDFGDGTDPGTTTGGTTLTPTHVYKESGTYTATLTVTDDDGVSVKSSVPVLVTNVAPTVSIGTSTVTIIAGESFNAVGAFVDPGADLWSATVDYGAGAQLLALAGNSFQIGTTYAAAGEYTVTVRVSDGDGGSGSASLVVSVQTPAQATEAVTNAVDVLVSSGELSSQDANALLSTLAAAVSKLQGGSSTPGVNQLEAFKNKLGAMVSSGRLSAGTAAALAAAIDRIIQQA